MTEIPEDISFPIRDVEELNSFERKLNMDKNLETRGPLVLYRSPDC